MKIVWSRTALADLKAVRAYIADTSPGTAQQIAARILESADQLAAFPASGRPGRVPDSREMVVQGLPYILPYTVHENRVVILAVLHTARQWPETF